MNREHLERLRQEFLARGGKEQVIPIGVTTAKESLSDDRRQPMRQQIQQECDNTARAVLAKLEAR